jgi:ribosomal protein L13
MNTPNYGLLNPKPSEPAGYVTKDEMWAAVPFGKKFMIIHNGEQIHVTGTLATAKSYINKQLKVSKTVKSSTSSLEEFL